eukprot:2279686-Pyramimonas_sp.AAC.1
MRDMMEEVEMLLNEKLEVMWGNCPDYAPPDPDHLSYNSRILEHTYYKINCESTGMTPEEKHKYEKDDATRRREGQQLLDLFSSRWDQERITHCCRGCCANRAVAVKKEARGGDCTCREQGGTDRDRAMG